MIEDPTDPVVAVLAQEVVDADCYCFRSSGPHRTVVDLGAHVGVFACMAADTGARVIAVEMDPVNYARLEKNAARSTIKIVHAAVVGKTAPTGFARGENTGCSRFAWAEGTTPIMQTLRLHELCEGLDTVDFLKVDIEGAEYDVIADARETGVIDRVRRIGMEWHRFACPTRSRPGVADLLPLLAGFAVEHTDPDQLTGYLWARRL